MALSIHPKPGPESEYLQDGTFTSAFDDLVAQRMDRWHIPGLGIAVIQDGEVIAKGYGTTNITSPTSQTTPQTLFNCASMTKSFTAAAMSLLVDDDEKYPDVKWDTPVSRLIGDDFVLMDGTGGNGDVTGRVTIEDLLCHRSGIPDCDDACFGIYAAEPDTPKSVTRKLRHIPLVHPFRTTFEYCNVGYVALAHLIETLTSRSLGSFLREHFFDPLGMNSTYYGLSELRSKLGDSAPGLATFHRWDEESKSSKPIPWVDQPEGSGCGEIYSNVLDWCKYLTCMLKRLPPLSKNGHRELIRPRIISHGFDKEDEEDEKWLRPGASHALYALGWEIENFYGVKTIGHTGGVTGCSCKTLYLPSKKWGVVVWANSDMGSGGNEGIVGALVEDLLRVESMGGKRFDWDAEMDRVWAKYGPKTKEELFPNLPEEKEKVGLVRGLEKYEGVYAHKGFGKLVIRIKEGDGDGERRLWIDCRDRTWRFELFLEDVGGEFWFVARRDAYSGEIDTGKAEFWVNVEGMVARFGVDALMDSDEMVWFERVDGK